MKFIAEELREYMAALGVRTVDELVGRTGPSVHQGWDALRPRQEGGLKPYPG